MNSGRLHMLGAALLLSAAAGLALVGQPDPERKWRYLAAELAPRLEQREVQIEPAELLSLMHDDRIHLRLVDVRGERDWNLFHLWSAERIELEALAQYRKEFAALPGNGVIVFVSNDEMLAGEAWKRVMAVASRPNAYILAGGINRWLDEFAPRAALPVKTPAGEPDGSLRYPMQWALGSRHPAALPDVHDDQKQEFQKRVKLQKRVVKTGGCG